MIWDLEGCLAESTGLPAIEDSVRHVKNALSTAIRSGAVDLEEEIRKPLPDHYARRLLREEMGWHFFERKGEIQALTGQTGSLIPPFEYHVLSNPTARPSVTLHIYGGEMAACNIYVPDSTGAYLREEKSLTYDA